MTARDQLRVRVSDELALDAGTCEEVAGPHGRERLIHLPEASRLERVCADAERHPSCLLANALVNTAWRNVTNVTDQARLMLSPGLRTCAFLVFHLDLVHHRSRDCYSIRGTHPRFLPALYVKPWRNECLPHS